MVEMDERAVVPPDPDTDPVWLLEPGVPYVPGWAEAQCAVAELLAELAACGLGGRLAYARAEVTSAGVGVVELGRISPATARRLTQLLRAARPAALPDRLASPDGGAAARPGRPTVSP